jgi:hypothetical protein
MPRRRPQGWRCSWGFNDFDFIDEIDFDELLHHVMSLYDVNDVDDCEDFDELIEYYDNQRW